MSELSRPDRLQIMLSAAELRVLDDWRFTRRMPSRAAAIRELLKRGLAVEGIDLETAGKQSANFGVLDDGGVEQPENSQGDARLHKDY
jgi:hypothetical protein